MSLGQATQSTQQGASIRLPLRSQGQALRATLSAVDSGPSAFILFFIAIKMWTMTLAMDFDRQMSRLPGSRRTGQLPAILLLFGQPR